MKKIIELKNGIQVLFKKSSNTPRVALCLNFSINQEEEILGTYSLMSRLFLQGTKTRNSEILAQELDENAIELSVDLKSDYLRFSFLCLNEDFEKALEILEDIVKNTTFNDYQKEILKCKGEIKLSQDSPRTKVLDGYYRGMFSNHPYGTTDTVILENIDRIKKTDIINAYENVLNNSRKVITVVGDIDEVKAQNIIEKAFDNLPDNKKEVILFNKTPILKSKEIIQVKEVFNQSDIVKGWLVPTYKSKEYGALLMLNVILGASGLSSRLFCELRDKKGLAYVVRSTYEVLLSAANFNIYIATEPKNIETALAGFKEEIDKIKTELVSEKELENARTNLFGTWAFAYETNSRQAMILSHYGILHLGFDYMDEIKKIVADVTTQDLLDCAQKYFNEDSSVLSVLKP